MAYGHREIYVCELLILVFIAQHVTLWWYTVAALKTIAIQSDHVESYYCLGCKIPIL